MTDLILSDRLSRVTTLKSGSHQPNDDAAFCVMEAVAYVAGEPWSDHPACTCPLITAFMVSWNDSLPNDDDRARLLLPLIPVLVGTRGSKALETRRTNMAADWYIRVQTPAWLRLAGLTTQAETLEAFPEITDFAAVPSLKPTLDAIRKDAAAAGDAARDAARDAAWDAARDAAWAAAGDAARAAAWDAAWAAARAAAWAAARAAAGDAAGDALAPAVTTLQESAVDLVKRMCALTDEATGEAA
jgi:hypothetical protein